MSDAVMLPLWLVIIMSVAAIATIYRHIVVPLSRMYLRSRERNLNEELSGELSRQLPEVLRIGRKARIELFANSPEVKQAIAQAVKENQGTKEVLEYKVHEYAKELTPGFYALFYFRIGYLLARTYIRLLYDVRVAKQPPPAIDNIPESASVVLVGNHRSNLDVMMLAYLSSRINMISFAAGEWGKAWPMSTLIHLSGSYIIRRNEPLPLYRKVLAMHLRNLVRAKMPQGIFLEGGLTRDGTIQSVKLGLMSYILSALDSENVDDIVFIPVAFNYDQVPEDKTLLRNQDKGFEGRSKLYTVFSAIISLLVVIYQKIKRGKTAYGKAAVSFGEPLSMQNWLADQAIRRPMDATQKRDIVTPVADDLIGEIKAIIPVLPVSIVAAVFVKAGSEALTEMDVQNTAASILQHLKTHQAIMAFEEREAVAAISTGIEMLVTRKVLFREDGYYRVNPDSELLLHYLYNSTKHLLM